MAFKRLQVLDKTDLRRTQGAVDHGKLQQIITKDCKKTAQDCKRLIKTSKDLKKKSMTNGQKRQKIQNFKKKSIKMAKIFKT